MLTISQRDLRNNSAAVMDGVEGGQTYRITRNGVDVAELRPINKRRRLRATELVERHRRLLPADYADMRAEADEFFGDEDRLDDEQPGG